MLPHAERNSRSGEITPEIAPDPPEVAPDLAALRSTAQSATRPACPEETSRAPLPQRANTGPPPLEAQATQAGVFTADAACEACSTVCVVAGVLNADTVGVVASPRRSPSHHSRIVPSSPAEASTEPSMHSARTWAGKA